MLAPRKIDPCRFHFLNSARTEKITQRRAFRAWNESIAQAVETGAEYLSGPHAFAGCRVKRYRAEVPGPVVLVTDALCYSTTDIFAAGFQDNQIGKVLGVDESTGAGGANVWEYPLICDLLRRPGQFPRDLPGSASFRFAVRRVTRIGRASGLPLEDFGVRPDEVHEFTRKDVLKRNVDLIHHAAALLGPMPKQRLTATRSGPSTFLVTCNNIDRVDAYIGDRPLTSANVRVGRFNLRVLSRRPGRELWLTGISRRGTRRGRASPSPLNAGPGLFRVPRFVRRQFSPRTRNGTRNSNRHCSSSAARCRDDAAANVPASPGWRACLSWRHALRRDWSASTSSSRLLPRIAAGASS